MRRMNHIAVCLSVRQLYVCMCVRVDCESVFLFVKTLDQLTDFEKKLDKRKALSRSS
jgi:hypothetical protein